MRARRLATALGAAVVATLSLSGCGFSLYNASLPGGADVGDHPFTVTAYFQDVLDLVPQSSVKVNDVPVGKVTGISLADCANPDGGTHKVWCAKVEVEVNNSVDLPQNARADILQTSLLGEKYVALQQPNGTASQQRLKNGDTIPFSRTTSAPETEDVLGALSLVLNKGGLDQIQVIATELNKALDSKNRQLAVRDLITQLNTFTGTLDDQKDKIVTALANVDTLAKTLNRQRTLIQESLDTFPAALKVLADQRSQLVKLLSSLSDFGGVAKNVISASQTQIVSALKSLKPAVDQLTASGADLPGALRIAGTFPFPLGLSNEFVKGDYANLTAYVEVNLTDLLQPFCDNGLPQSVCDTLNGIIGKLPLSAKNQKVKARTTSSSATLTPTLLGSGG